MDEGIDSHIHVLHAANMAHVGAHVMVGMALAGATVSDRTRAGYGAGIAVMGSGRRRAIGVTLISALSAHRRRVDGSVGGAAVRIGAATTTPAPDRVGGAPR